AGRHFRLLAGAGAGAGPPRPLRAPAARAARAHSPAHGAARGRRGHGARVLPLPAAAAGTRGAAAPRVRPAGRAVTGAVRFGLDGPRTVARARGLDARAAAAVRGMARARARVARISR